MAHCAHTIAAAIAAEDRRTAHEYLAGIEHYAAETLRHTVAGQRATLELMRFPPFDHEGIRAAYEYARSQHERLTADPNMKLPDVECEALLIELSEQRDTLRDLL